MRWPYDPKRVHEFEKNKEPATEKQIWYILKLSKDIHDKDETLNSIMDSIPGDLDVEDLTKGQAMYVIKCLNNEIQPVNERPRATRPRRAGR